jgi:Tol biopolymer transport system component
MLKARPNKNASFRLWLALLSVIGFFSLAPQSAMSSDQNSVEAPGFNIDSRWPSPTKSAHDGGGQLMPTRPMRFILKASVDSSGVHGNANSYEPSISADGRYVAFVSRATNLVPGDTNGQTDVFVHDRFTGTTTLVSVDSAGLQGNYVSDSSSISADGGFVAFVSGASNLVHADTNENWDVFVHDRATGSTTRVSVDSSGVVGDDASVDPSISSDGRYVAFQSWAANLVLDDRN